MSHFSDIGYEVSSEEEMSALVQHWVSDENAKAEKLSKGIFMFTRKVGEIWNFIKIQSQKKFNEITCFSMSYTNEASSEVELNAIEVDKKTEFPIIRVEIENIPFWFCCHNIDKKLKLKPHKKYKINITSFANSVEIKNASEKIDVPEDFDINSIKINAEKLEFADESYVSSGAFSGEEFDTAFVSGIIKAWKKEENLDTGNKFFVIDTTCLGLNFRILVAENDIKEEDLAVGKVISGEFWNTCFISKLDK